MTQTASPLDNLKSDDSFEKEMQAAVAERFAAEARGDAEPSYAESENIHLNESMGGHNAFYFMCNHFQGRTNYAVCQATIAKAKAGDDNLRPECQAAIDRGICPAVKMREREVTAGKALFFVDRTQIVRRIEERNNQPIDGIRYGKARGAYEGMKTVMPSSDVQEKFEERLKKLGSNTVTPSKKDADFNPDIAGRNLIGDVIDRMMGESK